VVIGWGHRFVAGVDQILFGTGLLKEQKREIFSHGFFFMDLFYSIWGTGFNACAISIFGSRISDDLL
jgi:hypothetical protein